jgi:hypothetical protein
MEICFFFGNIKFFLSRKKNNIKDIYHNFMKTLSNSINEFSIEVLCKKKNIIVNPWYDNESKIAKKNPLGMLLMIP